MPDLIVRISLSAEEAALFEGRNAMVVPLADAEVVELRDVAMGTLAFLREAAAGVPADPADAFAAALHRAAAAQERLCELIGRARFADGGPREGEAVQ